MSNIFSYCLFNGKKEIDRSYDLYKDKTCRYYFNLPAIIILNNILYPNSTTRIYIHKEVKTMPLFGFID